MTSTGANLEESHHETLSVGPQTAFARPGGILECSKTNRSMFEWLSGSRLVQKDGGLPMARRIGADSLQLRLEQSMTILARWCLAWRS